tara:strand:+ start:5151 stop:6617 length:1467 start_codon:yes stop_codon:yes gene_type:complete
MVSQIQTALASGSNEVNPVTLTLIAWVEEQIQALRKDYDLSRDYYSGKHRVQLTDRLKKFLPSAGYDMFRDNWCEVVVDAVAERLRVTGLQVETDGGSKGEDVAKWLWDLWRMNRGDQIQSRVHTNSVMMGDAYVLVDYNRVDNHPVWYYQEPGMIVPRYDPVTQEIAWASKKWTWLPQIGEDEETRLNIYYPDRIEKYIATGNKVWTPYRDVADAEWPIPWLDAAGEPIGVPLVHFPNDSLGDDFGRSEIANVIPLQDLLNKQIIDLTMVADSLGFGQRWTMNVDMKNSTLDVVPGSILELHSEEEKGNWGVGEYEMADLKDLLQAIEMLVQHVSGVSRTPQHLFHLSGNYPSGEALKTAESGLVSKVEERQLDFGSAWEDVMRLALRLEGVYGSDQTVDAASLRTTMTWKDPETRNDKDFLEGQKVKADLGVPQAQLWREMGYTQEQIDQMLDDKDDEKVRETNIGGALLRQFRQGQGPGGQGGAP